MSSDLAYATLTELGRRIRDRSLSPVELTQTLLQRTRALDPVLHAHATVFEEEALAQARQAERAVMAGADLGPLHGIPVGLKDIYHYGPTGCGAAMPRPAHPGGPCTTAAQLRQAGAVILGKHTCWEFALGMATTGAQVAAARNPWNPTLDPGGSSSGSAVALAAGLAFGSMGSDTGGSIRWPAACCGVVGIKPTFGLVSRSGVEPLAWSLDHAGPMARTVADTAVLLQAVAGYDANDSGSIRTPIPDYRSTLEAGVRGLRIGIPRGFFEPNCDPEILALFDEAAAQMRRLGAEVVEIASPTMGEIMATFWPIVSSESANHHLPALRATPEGYCRDLRLVLAFGATLEARTYLLAQRARRVLRHRITEPFERVDVLMMPTTGAQTAPLPDASPGMMMMAKDFPLYTLPWNLAGIPALAMPCGFTQGGLPVGMQLAARPFDEATLFRVGHAYERSTDWNLRRPPLDVTLS
jgi:aspartyl-tRNA(Asn)/glutamyl-tRNA(Gln) amidotransferase subunit A